MDSRDEATAGDTAGLQASRVGTTERRADDMALASFNRIRKDIKNIAAALLEVRRGFSQSPVTPIEDRGEVMANLTVAYRCLEDASMRLGKAIQARDGGVSVYDRDTTVGS